MMRCTRVAVGICVLSAFTLGASADQGSQLSRVMREKLAHSQAILGAVVTSNWPVLDRESRALAMAVRDPAWGATLIGPEYLRESDAFSRALQDLIEASAKRDLELAGKAEIALTSSCIRCHLDMTRRRAAH